MTTNGIASALTSPTTGSTATSSSGSSSQMTNSSLNLSPTDFVQFLITQMQNQDPLDPTSSDAMLSQLSQIGQLQSSSDLDTDLKGVALQNQVGSASAMIGKQVTGNDANNNLISGIVSSVNVTSTAASLQLDSGSTLSLSSVTSISNATAPSTPKVPS